MIKTYDRSKLGLVYYRLLNLFDYNKYSGIPFDKNLKLEFETDLEQFFTHSWWSIFGENLRHDSKFEIKMEHNGDLKIYLPYWFDQLITEEFPNWPSMKK